MLYKENNNVIDCLNNMSNQNQALHQMIKRLYDQSTEEAERINNYANITLLEFLIQKLGPYIDKIKLPLICFFTILSLFFFSTLIRDW